MLNKSNQLKNAKYIDIQSVGEKKQSLVFEIDEIVINNSKKENMPIMISKVDFLKNTGCDVVISGDLIN